MFDGAPSANTYDSDLYGAFFSIGYELFKDKGRLQSTFVAADIFDEQSELTRLNAQMNIVYAGAILHLFRLETQEKVASRIVQLLIPQPGSLLIGRQSGSENAGGFSGSGETSGRKHFRHNVQSWVDLWKRVGEMTGTEWKVEADLDTPEFTLSAPKGRSVEIQNKMNSKGLRITVRRL